MSPWAAWNQTLLPSSVTSFQNNITFQLITNIFVIELRNLSKEVVRFGAPKLIKVSNGNAFSNFGLLLRNRYGLLDNINDAIQTTIMRFTYSFRLKSILEWIKKDLAIFWSNLIQFCSFFCSQFLIDYISSVSIRILIYFHLNMTMNISYFQ